MIFAKEKDINIFVLAVNYLVNETLFKSDDPEMYFFYCRSGFIENDEVNLLSIWNLFDTDHSRVLEKDEFIKFLKKMNFSTVQASIDELFKTIDSDKSGKIEFAEFEKYYYSLINGSELNSIFKSFSNNSDLMTVKQLISFIQKYQGQIDFTEFDGVEVCLKLKPNIIKSIKTEIKEKMKSINFSLSSLKELEGSLSLNLREFKVFIYDLNLNNLYNTEMIWLEHDMNRPMNDYFVSSSHNTYICDHQLFGESSIGMYNFAISEGLRLVELDCWVCY